MPAIAVVGANWGDEGKGKIIDYLAGDERVSMVVRFQGGGNAGHTINNEFGRFALHLLPSGVFYPHITNVIGHGVALNLPAFIKELEELKERGINPKIKISDRCQILLPCHILLDELEEKRRGSNSFGSTKQGIAPFYSDKVMKIGIQVCDLYDEFTLLEKLETLFAPKYLLLQSFYNEPNYRSQNPIHSTLFSSLKMMAEKIKPYVCDTLQLIDDEYNVYKYIILEGQLGALRDIDHGIYPFTTSSSPLAGYASVGAGVPPTRIHNIIAVTKAYSSCVGAGPFVSEIFGDEAEELRKRGGDRGEYGATTGRPRRVGWFDCVATRYGCKVQGATDVALTNLDVLGYMDTIPICIKYKINDEWVDNFPTTNLLKRSTPGLHYCKGWKCDISGIRKFDNLPKEAQAYVEEIENMIGFSISLISVGPNREQTIER